MLRGLRRTLQRLAPPEDVTAGGPPIFVHGMSRSGGTLAATILDAHPEVAMSYELYPWMLEDAPAGLAQAFDDAPTVRKGATKLPPNLKTFFLRGERSGLGTAEIAEALHARDDLSTEAGRITLVARLARAKMRMTGKSRWGVKCGIDFAGYTAMWPGARFVGIVRDGRDVLASQQTTGSFDRDAAHIARAWVRDFAAFQALIDDQDVQALRVRYESLVAGPEPEIRRIAEFAGVEFDERMLHHSEQELTVFDAHHLSMDRITVPIDATQVGRWRRDVSPEDIEAFWTVAGDTMAAAGYA